jgi:leucyl aminopeptidase (aminopeptidase T)
MQKGLGRVHIALGDSAPIHLPGGKVKSEVHIDGVILKPIVEVDGKIVVKNGKLNI